MSESIAREALDLAKQNEQKIDAHEDLCAVRYAGIEEKISEIKGALKWGGGSAFGIIITVLGFLAAAQFTANDRFQDEAIRRGEQQQQKIETLQRELLEARSSR